MINLSNVKTSLFMDMNSTTFTKPGFHTTEIQSQHDTFIDRICSRDRLVTESYKKQLTINTDLNRRLVSFQGNKLVNGHRWYNYREGFSSELVKYCIENLNICGPLLDPFAGSGTTLFTASRFGIDSIGIELLPNSIDTIQVRQLIQSSDNELTKHIKEFVNKRSWTTDGPSLPLTVFNITHH